MAVTPASKGGNTSSAEPSGVSRRSVARGVAWATPAVVIGAAAPAQAASPTPVLSGLVFVGKPQSGDVQVMTATTATPTPAVSMCVGQTTVNTAITNFSSTIWLASSTLTFAVGSKSNPCWSLLSRDTSQPNKLSGGITYYAYTTKYTCPITATAGQTCLPIFNFTAAGGGPTLRANSFFKNVQATVNGVVQNVDTGPIALTLM